MDDDMDERPPRRGGFDRSRGRGGTQLQYKKKEDDKKVEEDTKRSPARNTQKKRNQRGDRWERKDELQRKREEENAKKEEREQSNIRRILQRIFKKDKNDDGIQEDTLVEA